MIMYARKHKFQTWMKMMNDATAQGDINKRRRRLERAVRRNDAPTRGDVNKDCANDGDCVGKSNES